MTVLIALPTAAGTGGVPRPRWLHCSHQGKIRSILRPRPMFMPGSQHRILEVASIARHVEQRFGVAVTGKAFTVSLEQLRLGGKLQRQGLVLDLGSGDQFREP